MHLEGDWILGVLQSSLDSPTDQFMAGYGVRKGACLEEVVLWSGRAPNSFSLSLPYDRHEVSMPILPWCQQTMERTH